MQKNSEGGGQELQFFPGSYDFFLCSLDSTLQVALLYQRSPRGAKNMWDKVLATILLCC